MCVRDLGKVSSMSCEQPLKASMSILLTDLGILTCASEVHIWKARSRMLRQKETSTTSSESASRPELRKEEHSTGLMLK